MIYEKAPESIEVFFQRLNSKIDSLPSRLKQCAEYLLNHPDEVAFATVSELSVRAGVQPSAVMRFCQVMGFAGYSDMQKLFRSKIRPSPPEYSERIKNLHDNGADSPSAILAEFIETGRQSLELLSGSVDENSLTDAINVLANANLIHIVGQRRSYPVSSYLSYALEKLSIPAMQHDGRGNITQKEALRAGDAVIAITFAPYSPETISVVDEAIARGLPTIVISDSPALPIKNMCYTPLIVPEIDFGAFRSLSATLTLAISLAVSIGTTRSKME